MLKKWNGINYSKSTPLQNFLSLAPGYGASNITVHETNQSTAPFASAVCSARDPTAWPRCRSVSSPRAAPRPPWSSLAETGCTSPPGRDLTPSLLSSSRLCLSSAIQAENNLPITNHAPKGALFKTQLRSKSPYSSNTGILRSIPIPHPLAATLVFQSRVHSRSIVSFVWHSRWSAFVPHTPDGIQRFNTRTV